MADPIASNPNNPTAKNPQSSVLPTDQSGTGQNPSDTPTKTQVWEQRETVQESGTANR